MTLRPPQLAERLLALTLAGEDRDVVLGDLAEEFAVRAEDLGLPAARRWYRRQCWRSAASNLRGRWEGARERRPRDSGAPPRTPFAFAGGSMRDIRDAFRALRSAPNFTIVALIVLTLGIGASTAIFSVVDAVVLRDLPLNHSDRLMIIGQIRTDRKQPVAIAAPDYADFRKQDIFESMGAWTGADSLTTQSGQPEILKAIRVTASLFSVLRVAPHYGTLFSEADEAAGADRVALISDGLWKRRFGANPNAVGQTVETATGTWRVVGVMPAGFTFPLDRPTDMWVPIVVPPADLVRGSVFHSTTALQLIGRLRAGVTVAQARTRMETVSAALTDQFPGWFKNRATTVRPLRETIIGAQVQSWMLMLLAAVAFVLLIACVNVASLMLARASARSREMGVRAALGASRWQLIRGVLIESLMLSAAGTTGGLLCAYAAVGAIRSALPANLPRSATIGVNWRVLLAATGAAVVTGLVCGLLPAIQASRPNLSRALREGGRSASATRARQRLRAVLVAAEVGLAIILLVGAGLFMSSFVRLSSVDLGVNYQHVLTVGLTPRGQYPTREARDAAAAKVTPLVNDVLPIVRAIPGVESAAALSGTRPFEGGNDRSNITIHGREQDFKGDEDAVDVYRVTPDYTTVLGVPLVRGRLFRPDETNDSSPVALLNQTAAARFFPGADPIGQTVGLLGERIVVGIVHDVRAGGPEMDTRPEAYLPFAHGWAPFAYLVVKTKGDPAATVAQVKAAVWSSAPDLALPDVQTLEEFLGRLVAPRRFNMLLIGFFGVLALAIASVGIYGVMAYVVEQRTAEIGLRMALGARPGEVVALILRRALSIVVVGLVVGLAVAWPLAQTLRVFLFQVQPHEVVVYAGASLVLLGAGLAAAFGPARRASRVDPVIALRAD